MMFQRTSIAINKFYFEEENKYIAFSLELYKIMMVKYGHRLFIQTLQET